MGLDVYVYRAPDGDFTGRGISSKTTRLCVVNVDGPSEPVNDPGSRYYSLPAMLAGGNLWGTVKLVPACRDAAGEWVESHLPGMLGPMFGGNYAATSDSRFNQACERLLGHRFYGAVPVHDRFETPQRYELLSR